MKTCTKCNIEKPLTEFDFKYKSKGIRRAQCKKCVSNYSKNLYLNKVGRRELIRKRHKENRRYLLKLVKRYKTLCGCKKCGDKRWYVLDFHHEHEKEFAITTGIREGIGMNKLKEEIRKCIVVCANCHREIHHKG